MANFNCVRKGYNKSEVDNFIVSEEKKFKDKFDEQMLLIQLLKEENFKIKKENEVYKDKENSVTKALLTAVDKAKEMDVISKIRFSLEGERIKIFQAKWTSYCKENRKTINIKVKDETQDYLNNMKEEIFGAMQKDLSIFDKDFYGEALEQFGREQSRLKRQNNAGFENLRRAIENNEDVEEDEEIENNEDNDFEDNEEIEDNENEEIEDKEIEILIDTEMKKSAFFDSAKNTFAEDSRLNNKNNCAKKSCIDNNKLNKDNNINNKNEREKLSSKNIEIIENNDKNNANDISFNLQDLENPPSLEKLCKQLGLN
ncbi:MAG: hypothetical protein RR454_01540 [Clostridia bacterium]